MITMNRITFGVWYQDGAIISADTFKNNHFIGISSIWDNHVTFTPMLFDVKEWLKADNLIELAKQL